MAAHSSRPQFVPPSVRVDSSTEATLPNRSVQQPKAREEEGSVGGGLLAWRVGSAALRGLRDSTTLATTGLGLASPEDEEAPCQAWETTGGHFMSHTERSARAVSRCFAASSPILPARRRGESRDLGSLVCSGGARATVGSGERSDAAAEDGERLV
jgi:hypothetical protein